MLYSQEPQREATDYVNKIEKKYLFMQPTSTQPPQLMKRLILPSIKKYLKIESGLLHLLGIREIKKNSNKISPKHLKHNPKDPMNEEDRTDRMICKI